jgi:nicotinamide mononucleotide transporter
MFEWVGSEAFRMLNTPLSWGELAGFTTGLWCVWLATRKSLWNFPVGIVNALLLLVLFVQVRLFADASLQLAYAALGVHGWVRWTRGPAGGDEPVSRVALRLALVSGVSAAALACALTVALIEARGGAPLFDAALTALSLLAQYWFNRKLLENWLVWIAVDLICIPLYATRQLYLIAGLYCLFLLLCVQGFRKWKQAYDQR